MPLNDTAEKFCSKLNPPTYKKYSIKHYRYETYDENVKQNYLHQNNENDEITPPPLPPPCRYRHSASNIPPPLVPRGPNNLPPPPSLQYLRTVKKSQLSTPTNTLPKTPPTVQNKKIRNSIHPPYLMSFKTLKTQFCTNV